MRILHIIPHYFPSPYFGGTPVVCHNIAKEQTTLGHQVDILTTDVYSENKRIEKEKLNEKTSWGYNIIRKRNLSNLIAFRFKQSISWEAFAFIWKYANQYDVVHLHEYRSLLNVMISFANTQRSKIILHPQGTFENFNGRTFIKAMFDRLFSVRILNKATQIIALSEKEKNTLLLAGVSPNKIALLHNGIQVEKSTVSNFSAKPSQKYILYLGRINRIKNLDLLVDAFKASNIWRNNIKLIIAGGDDGYLKQLKHKVENQVTIKYIGPVNEEDKYDLIKNSLFVAYITTNEPWGLVPLEAGSLGVPSLVSQDAGIANIITRFKIGRLVDLSSSTYVSESIQLMINKPIKISKATSKQLQDELSWENYAQKLMKIYSL